LRPVSARHKITLQLLVGLVITLKKLFPNPEFHRNNFIVYQLL